LWEALGRRLRRNYFWIFLILYASWMAKTWLNPEPAASLAEFIDRAAIGPIPGQVMFVLGLIFYTTLAILAVATITMTHATGEILPRFGEDSPTISVSDLDQQPRDFRSWFTHRRRRRQLIALIITGEPEKVSKRILADLRRGVTAIRGTGMYTGSERTILICALTVTEVHNLKMAVAKEDPQAFVVVSPAQEILGRGFNPLEEE
jgi:hypothetical protein